MCIKRVKGGYLTAICRLCLLLKLFSVWKKILNGGCSWHSKLFWDMLCYPIPFIKFITAYVGVDKTSAWTTVGLSCTGEWTVSLKWKRKTTGGESDNSQCTHCKTQRVPEPGLLILPLSSPLNCLSLVTYILVYCNDRIVSGRITAGFPLLTSLAIKLSQSTAIKF